MADQYQLSVYEELDGGDGDIQPVAGLPGFSKSNALSNKITSILSSSYADSEIRSALSLLDARIIENTAEARRNLRLDAQKEVIDCNVAILDEFGEVAAQLKRVGAMIATLNETCDQMRKHINSARSESAPMLEEASLLMASKHESETKQSLLDAFNSYFITTDEDLTLLTSSAEPVNDRFFAILSRVKTVHEDCETLLGSENQRLGLELMEQSSKNLDAGFKKLYSWIQRSLKTLDFEDPQISSSMRRALRVLSERPSLFQNCLDLLAEARENSLSDAFQIALTDTAGTASNAIEFSTHDLLRYMGDMLAWVHSTTVSEKEALEGLFVSDEQATSNGIKSGRANEPWSHLKEIGVDDSEHDIADASTFDGHKALNDLISHSLATVSTILRDRTDLAVRHHDDAVLVYKAFNLLTFYEDVFTKLIGPESTLCNILSSLQTSTFSYFEHLIQDEIAAKMSDALPEGYPHARELMESPLRTLTQLTATMGPKAEQTAFENLFSIIVRPYCDTVTGGRYGNENLHDSTIFSYNCMSLIMASVSKLSETIPPAVAGSTLQHYAARANTFRESLVKQQAEMMGRESGVRELVKGIKRWEKGDKDDEIDHQGREKWLRNSLPLYADQLDTFLSEGCEIVRSRFSFVEGEGLAAGIFAGAREEFLAELVGLEELLAEVDEEMMRDGDVGEEIELRALYPRTAEEAGALM